MYRSSPDKCQEKQQPRMDCGKYNSHKQYQINFILMVVTCRSKIFLEHSGKKKCTPDAIVLPPWSIAQRKNWMEINRSYMVSRNTLVFKVWSSNIHIKHFHPPICLAILFSKPCFNSALDQIIFLPCSMWPSDTPSFNKQQQSDQKVISSWCLSTKCSKGTKSEVYQEHTEKNANLFIDFSHGQLQRHQHAVCSTYSSPFRVGK